jgi:hypothetical protein
MEPGPDEVLITEINIRRTLSGDDDHFWYQAQDGEGNDPPLFEILGLLELAKDTAFHVNAGTVPGEDDDDG